MYHPLKKIAPHLETHPRGYFPFESIPNIHPSSPGLTLPDTSSSLEEDVEDDHPLPSDPPPPSFLRTSSISLSALKNILVMTPTGYLEWKHSGLGRVPAKVQSLKELVAALHGPEKREGSAGVMEDDGQMTGLVVITF